LIKGSSFLLLKTHQENIWIDGRWSAHLVQIEEGHLYGFIYELNLETNIHLFLYLTIGSS
jgi:hypothetical protein